MSGSLNQNLRPRRHPDAAWREIGDQTAVVTPDDGKLHMLNGVASAIWKLMDGEKTIGDIADEIAREYDAPRETALKDIEDFIMELVEKKLESGAKSVG